MSRIALLSALLAAGTAGAATVLSWRGGAADPDMLIDGQPATVWTDIAANTTLTATDAPADLSQVRTVSLSVHCREPADTILTLVFASENAQSEGSDYYSVAIRTNFAGTRRFDFPRPLLSATRTPLGWDRINRIFISSNWAHRLDPETDVRLGPLLLDSAEMPGFDMPPGELLPNRQFRADSDADGTPDGWSFARFGTDVRTERVQDPETGAGMVRITGTPGSRGGISHSIGPEALHADRVFLFRATVSADGMSGHEYRTAARFTSVDAGGSVLASDYRVCPPGVLSRVPLEWLVTFPPGTVRANVVLFHHGAGTAVWEDVSLRQLLPIRALAPTNRATVPEQRPVLRWETPVEDGLLEIVGADTGFGSGQVRRFPVSGTEAPLPEPLPPGKDCLWRVTGTTPDGTAAVTVAEGADGVAGFPGFFAGTWAQRTAALTAAGREEQESIEALKRLAVRTGMWDAFSAADAVSDALRALNDGEPDRPAEALDAVRTARRELQSALPWWRMIFLDDAALFAGLRRDVPGLEAAHRAAAAGDSAAARAALRDYFRSRRLPSYYGRWEDAPPRNPARTSVPDADRLLTHKMPIHSYTEPVFDLGPALDWHVFPIDDVEWPTKLHRHFHWDTLAGAYRATGNEAYAREIALQLLDWAMDNPMEPWDRERYRWAWSTLNATVRIYSSWINAWLRVRTAESWNPDAQFVMLTLLREHGRFLMTHAARQGNWVVAEARGLVELGTLFPEFVEAEAWRNEGYRRLRRELDLQVLPDGIHVERTPGYHAMTLSCFAEPVRLALMNDTPVEGLDRFTEVFEKMHEFYLYAGRPDGRMPQIGDGGMSRIAEFMIRGYEQFGREDMRFVATQGKEGAPPVVRSYAFDHAGFYVSRSAWNDPNALWSILDWGGFLGHCHEDMGHISLSAYGTNLLVDTGRYSYAWPMRAPFFQTRGHNTVTVDGQTQKRRDPLAARSVITPHFDAFTGLTDNSEPLLHERTLVFATPTAENPGYWLLTDRLTGTGKHRLEQRWHTTEASRIRMDGVSAILTPADPAREDGAALVAANLPQPLLAATVEPGAVSYGWYEKTPVDVASFVLETDMPAGFATVLYPTPPGTPPATVSLVRIDARIDNRRAEPHEVTALRAGITARGKTREELWIVRHADAGTVRAGPVETDARIACVRDADGDNWFAADASFLNLDGAALFSSPEPVSGIGLRTADGHPEAVCTGGTGLVLRMPPNTLVNGAPIPGTRDGDTVRLAEIPPPAVPEPPRNGKPPALLPPETPPAPEATAFMIVLPRDGIPAPAAEADAADFTAEEGGNVEITRTKTGALGTAFLHWDRAGHSLEYRLRAPAAGTYRVAVRACTAEDRVLRRVAVNGAEPPEWEAVEFAGTGGYSNARDDWREFVIPGEGGKPAEWALAAGGDLILRLTNVDGRSLNLDRIALLPAP